MEEKLCAYCGELFSLPNPAFEFLKFAGYGSQLYLERREQTELIHRLESAKRTALILKRRELAKQGLKWRRAK